MFYLFYGTDRDGTRAKMKATLLGAQKKRPDAEVFTIDAEDFSAGKLDELIGSAGLFEKKFIVCMNRVCEDEEKRAILVDKLKEIKETENLFLFLEGKVDAKSLEKFKKYAERVEEFSLEKNAGKNFALGGGRSLSPKDFNIFAISDAIGKRDKKELWALYRKAVELEIPSEETAGILFWQIKSMILSSESGNANEAGLNPFVYSKSKNYAKNFKEGELKDISSKLIALYHDAHRGIGEFEIDLERFVLSL